MNAAHPPVGALRGFLLLEAGLLVAASLVHGGLLLLGHAHSQARVAEAVIAAVLLTAWALSLVWPGRTRKLALLAQAFALIGTLVGVFTIAAGIGPQSAPDVVFHVALLALLLAGLRFARRVPA
ncbi:MULTISPECIES: hypothetical protein [unclassified Polaromonas]|uniref:hypothetical protein n=1 Tax=unclassified Polaromonas TaxID=2638319 RepID=UPI000F081861|nr:MULTISPECIES: hypothetical protein [unclassified Polaromonas]AYQ27492.1 hypothetical protein DT070_05275 [Polaromonas sp. SP1]QGJ17667.1 hypothetical protein F7R28_04170 [Polaromonas sp. Pch-P]